MNGALRAFSARKAPSRLKRFVLTLAGKLS